MLYRIKNKYLRRTAMLIIYPLGLGFFFVLAFALGIYDGCKDGLRQAFEDWTGTVRDVHSAWRPLWNHEGDESGAE